MKIYHVATRSLLAFLMVCGAAVGAELKPGDKAPEFVLPGSHGEEIKLVDYLDKKKYVVIAWYPKAFTGG